MKTRPSIKFLNNALDLEEPLQPPNLEAAVGYQYKKLEDAPPFDSAICALGRVSMRPFSHYDVPLFVLDLIDQFSHGTYWKSVSDGSAIMTRDGESNLLFQAGLEAPLILGHRQCRER